MLKRIEGDTKNPVAFNRRKEAPKDIVVLFKRKKKTQKKLMVFKKGKGASMKCELHS